MKNKLFNILTLIVLGLFILLPSSVYAATANVKVSSSASSIVVGNTFKITVKITSTAAMGAYNYTLSYDSSRIKLTSGDSSVVGWANNASTKTFTNTFTFKAIASGNPKITIKSYEIIAFSNDTMSVNLTPVNVKTLTKAQLEATYSDNNYLSSLSVKDYKLTPSFDKNILEYKVSLDPNVETITISATKEHNKASVNGTGNISVSEGDNKISIKVTSQKGNTRTYNIIATVTDNNPIKVMIDDLEYTVVKKSSILESPSTYTEKEIVINEQKIPAFYSEITDYNLVGLKSQDGEVNLYIYNEQNNTYNLYKEIKFEGITFYPLKFKEEIKNYQKESITINNITIEGYKFKKDSTYALIYGVNIESGEEAIYMYDSKENTIQKFNMEHIKFLEQELNDKDFINKILIIGIIVEFLLIAITAINKLSRRKTRKKENKIEKNISEKTIQKKEKTKEIEKTKPIEKIKNKEKEKN